MEEIASFIGSKKSKEKGLQSPLSANSTLKMDSLKSEGPFANRQSKIRKFKMRRKAFFVLIFQSRYTFLLCVHFDNLNLQCFEKQFALIYQAGCLQRRPRDLYSRSLFLLSLHKGAELFPPNPSPRNIYFYSNIGQFVTPEICIFSNKTLKIKFTLMSLGSQIYLASRNSNVNFLEIWQRKV